MNQILPETVKVSIGVAPAVLVNATPAATPWVPMPEGGLLVRITKGKDAAAGVVPTLTISQATSGAGAGAKTIPGVLVWTKSAATVAGLPAQYTPSVYVAAAALGVSGEFLDAFYFIPPGNLDGAGGFSFVNISIVTATADGQTVSADLYSSARNKGRFVQ